MDYVIETKKTITRQRLEHLLVLRRAVQKHRLLLLAGYVAPPMAQRLAKAGIDYVDTAGNVHLHRPGQLYVFVQSQRPQAPPDRRPTRLFQPSGLQVLGGHLVDDNELTYEECGAYLLGRDLVRLAKPESLVLVREFVEIFDSEYAAPISQVLREEGHLEESERRTIVFRLFRVFRHAVTRAPLA